MIENNSAMSRDDVLDAFLLEDKHDGKTLARYLRDFPEHAGSLIDMSREISREVRSEDVPLTPAEQSRIDAAWIVYKAASSEPSTDPLTSMSTEKSKQIASNLSVPRQVVTCFRERRVEPESVPRAFLTKFSEAIGVAVDEMFAMLAQPVRPALARSYKAASKPGSSQKVSFEQILIDAGVSDDVRTRLLSEDT